MNSLIFLLPFVVAAECELPAWLRNASQAIRDSSDLIVEATVVGLDVLPIEEGAEAEATLAVRRAWRAPTTDTLRARILILECGPELSLARTYFLGVKRNWHGQETTAFAAILHLSEPGFEATLGEASPVSPSANGSRVVPWAAALALLVLVAIGVVMGRRARSA